MAIVLLMEMLRTSRQDTEFTEEGVLMEEGEDKGMCCMCIHFTDTENGHCDGYCFRETITPFWDCCEDYEDAEHVE